MGYLYHPHTSAGRVPTDEGYRFYVDGLMGHRPLSPADTAAIRSRLRTRDASPDQVMENASHLLSRLSRHVGFVLAPDIGRTTLPSRRSRDASPPADPRRASCRRPGS